MYVGKKIGRQLSVITLCGRSRGLSSPPLLLLISSVISQLRCCIFVNMYYYILSQLLCILLSYYFFMQSYFKSFSLEACLYRKQSLDPQRQDSRIRYTCTSCPHQILSRFVWPQKLKRFLLESIYSQIWPNLILGR